MKFTRFVGEACKQFFIYQKRTAKLLIFLNFNFLLLNNKYWNFRVDKKRKKWIIYHNFTNRLIEDHMQNPLNTVPTSKLRIFRELNNFTQKYVGEDILGISQNTYSRLEQNPKRITKDQAEKLAELYNITITQLLSDDTPIVSFHNNTIDKAFIQNYYETQKELIDIVILEKDKQIEFLKTELEFAKKQFSDILEKISGKF
ncbi:helix-turn-helix domain-containing protein [Pedobacter suwonensis]|uniref:helix-turn-helix domain-containing protein n=1 Tax=Pedobacter suwonensis TaxID=332999 RepID=UPI003815EC24